MAVSPGAPCKMLACSVPWAVSGLCRTMPYPLEPV